MTLRLENRWVKSEQSNNPTDSLSSKAGRSHLSAADHAVMAEQEAMQEEIRRRSALLEKKETAFTAQTRLLEAAEQKIRELVRSEGEANYKARTLTAKISTLEKEVEETRSQRKGVERLSNKIQQDYERLKFEHQAVTEKLRALQETHQTRDASSDRLEQKNRDLESKLARTSSKIDLYRGKVESLQRLLTDKDTEGLLNQQKFELSSKEVQRLKSEVLELREESKAQKETRTQLEEAVFASQKMLAELKSELDLSKLHLEKLEGEKDSVVREKHKLHADLEESRQETSEQTHQVEELLEQIQALESYHAEEIEALQEELTKREIEQKRLNQTLALESATDSEAIRQLKEELASLTEDSSSQSRQISELTRWAERVRPAYETLKQKFSQLQGEYRQLHAAHSESREQHRQQNKLIEALQVREREKDDVIQELSAELETGNEQFQEQERHLESTRATLENALQAEDQQKKKVEALQSELAQSETVRVQFEQELEEVHHALEDLTRERLETDERLMELGLELEQTKNEAAALAARNQETQAQNLRLNEELSHQQSQTNKVQSNLKELLRQRTQLMDQKRQLEEELANSQVEESDLRLKIAELESDHQRGVVSSAQLKEQLEEAEKSWSTELARLKDELSVAHSDWAELNSEKDRLEARTSRSLSERDEDVRRLEHELLEASEQNELTVKQLEEITEEFDHSLARAEELEQSLAKESAENRRLREGFEEAASEREELNQELLDLGRELEAAHTELVNRKEDLRRRDLEREQLTANLEAALKQNKALREMAARGQKEALGLREYIDKLQTLSRERLEQAKAALQKRDGQLRKQSDEISETKRRVERLERQLERSKLANAAFKGAMTDLRHQIVEKDEMVEELEWHLGLVYQTLEDGQRELASKETANLELSKDFDNVRTELSRVNRRVEELEAALEEENDERLRAESQIEELEVKLNLVGEQLKREKAELEQLTFQLARANTRLEEALDDLTEEQERSVNIGLQLTEALEERNRKVQRLREVQNEFSDWRLEQGGGELDLGSGEVHQLADDLAESQAQEAQLRAELQRLQDRLRSQDEKLESQELAARGPAESSAADVESLIIELNDGIELGVQVLRSQMEVMQSDVRREQLTQLMNQVETRDALAALLDDLRLCDEEKSHQEELFSTLSEEWDEFCETLSPPTLELLQFVVGIIDTEMNEAQSASAMVMTLQQQLEQAQERAQSEFKSDVYELEQKFLNQVEVTEKLETELSEISLRLIEATEKLESQGDPRALEDTQQVATLVTRLEEFDLLKENTVEDLPAIPYSGDVEASVGLESTLPLDPSDSPNEAPDS